MGLELTHSQSWTRIHLPLRRVQCQHALLSAYWNRALPALFFSSTAALHGGRIGDTTAYGQSGSMNVTTRRRFSKTYQDQRVLLIGGVDAMSYLKGTEKEDNLEFKWGIKKGIGRLHGEEVQFYESFTYDGVEYFLYDCVYMYRENEPELDIGNLVKIWETPSHKKRVKVLWFFRPIEIHNWLQDDEPLQNEIFLASGEGKGLSNLNPLEALSGKCNVVCTSKDKRNFQASEVELKMADYIFYRTFDVGSCTISDKFPDTIAGIKVEFFFNNKDQKLGTHPKFNANLKEGTKNYNSALKLDPDEVVANAVKYGKSGTSGTVVKESNKPVTSLGEQAGCPDENIALKAKPFTENDGTRTSRISCIQCEDKVRCSGDSSLKGASYNRPLKKRKYLDSEDTLKLQFNASSSKPAEGCDNKIMQAPNIGSKAVCVELPDPLSRLPDSKSKILDTKSSASQNRGLSMGLGTHEKASMISSEALAQPAQIKVIKTDSQVVEVTRRPDADTNKWFKPLPWEERMQQAYKNGTLVLLENLDPSYTSSDVEDMVWHAFKQKVNARVIERNAFSSPHYGQAFVIFRSKSSADLAISELSGRCLMLTDGRLVVGHRASPREPNKPTPYFGHLVINKVKLQKQREEMKKAVSTSHCSQPNTIEYEMALEWRVLQEKSDIWWKALHEQQAKEIEDLRSQLKDLP